jgi:septal ring factor EnvC (AmiA/AmiB activator)
MSNLLDPNENYKFSAFLKSDSPKVNSELEQLKERIGYVENESLASTRQALRSLNDSLALGSKTTQTLDEQGEQLKRVETTLDSIDQGLSSTQTNIKQLKSIFGTYRPKFFDKAAELNGSIESGFNKSKSSKKSKHNATKDVKQEINNSNNSNLAARSIGDFSSGPMSSAQFARITGSDRETEINKNLEDVSMSLSQLKDMSLAINSELGKQNTMIGRIDDKAEKNKIRLDDQNTQIRRIMK